MPERTDRQNTKTIAIAKGMAAQTMQPVRTELGVRSDVRGIEHGQRPLAGHGASALVCIGPQQSEGALAEPRLHTISLAVPIAESTMM